MTMRQRTLSNYLRQALFGGVALCLCACWPANADAAGQDANANPPDAKPATGTPPASKDKAKQLGAITVTAQSRTQQMQDVPIAMQIVTAKQIDTLAATDLSKMTLFVPGLVVGGEQPTQPSYEMRGISTSDFGIGTESAVGVYVDGVYAARSGGALLAFNDIQRIEVLKGPQGTLFGRNAAGGAISIVTNEPSDTFEAKARVRIGDYGERYADALLNLPINKDMALRLSVLDNQSDGWVKDQANGQHYGKNDDWGTRAVYRWNIAPDTRVLLAWDHEQLKQPPRPAFGLIPPSDFIVRDGIVKPPFPADSSSYLNPLDAPLYNDTVNPIEKRRFDGVTLTVDHSFDWGSFTSTTAWRNFDTLNRGDYDGTASITTYLDTANIEHNNSWYQEFKLAGSTGLIDWVAGTSWYSEQARQASQTDTFTNSIDTLAENVEGAPYTSTFAYLNSALQAYNLPYHVLGDPWQEQIANDGNFKAYAAYGDVIWHLSDNLNLTTGARFTLDDKDFSWFNPPRYAPQLDQTLVQLAPLLALFGVNPSVFEQNIIFNAASGDPVNLLVRAHNEWRNFSPRAVLDYHFTPDTMGYVSITRGYKAGGYNSVEIGSHFAPEHVTNYEAGIKAVFPEHDLLLDASTYYYTYDNLQALALDPNTTGSGVPIYVVSTSDQHAKGVDVDLQWQPTDALRLALNGAYIDADYSHYIAPSGANLAGQPTGEPLYSFSANGSYTWNDVANGSLVFNLSEGYRGKTRCNNDSLLQGTCQISPNFTIGSAQQRTDARLDWNAAGDRWGVGVYVTNLFDKRYVTGINNITTSVFGTPFANITPPRMWGMELRVKL